MNSTILSVQMVQIPIEELIQGLMMPWLRNQYRQNPEAPPSQALGITMFPVFSIVNRQSLGDVIASILIIPVIISLK